MPPCGHNSPVPPSQWRLCDSGLKFKWLGGAYSPTASLATAEQPVLVPGFPIQDQHQEQRLD